MRTVSSLLKQRGGHVHMTGICGVGMAGLALLLKGRGMHVTGCDASPNRLGDWLSAQGIRVLRGHDASHVETGVDWIIRSAAVPPTSAEIGRAETLKLPVFRRGEVLPELLTGRPSIAVTGTHGKTTTSSWIAQILRHAQRDPSWCIGGETSVLEGVAGSGDGPIVVEADESDGTIVLYRPDVAVVTNIEFDHMEHFRSEKDFGECFLRFARQAASRLIFCKDDKKAEELLGGFPRTFSFGLSEDADFSARDIIQEPDRLSFSVVCRGEVVAKVAVPVPGRHNVLNALAAMAACREFGVSPQESAAALEHVELPGRRFETVVGDKDLRVVSDYAHHPTEIRALVGTASAIPRKGRLRVVFQPHRYTRTKALGGDFPAAFDGADEVVLVPVYAASESRIPGGTVWDLYRHFRDDAARRVFVASSLEHAWAYLRETLAAGDVLLIAGAGDIERLCEWARTDLLEERRLRLPEHEPMARELLSLMESDATRVTWDTPLARNTTLGVGGAADMFAEIGSVADLERLLKWAEDRSVPIRILGGGSNVLVSDLGVRGLTVRLRGKEFRGITVEDCIARVGAGTPLAAMLDFFEKQGWGGLEFLEGIPGCVGGAVRQNAGAYGGEIGGHIAWIRCLNRDGTPCIVKKTDLGFRYRCCEAARARVVVEVGFEIEASERAGIRERRREIAEKKKWMRGMRSAGSIFKNPDGHLAGRLLDSVGCKGFHVGGARFSEQHANVIEVSSSGSASDVLAAIEIAKDRVWRDRGLRLEEEIDVWE